MNTNYIWAAASFVMGSCIGVAVSWLITKKHYEKKHQEEMDVVWQDLQKNTRKAEEKEIKERMAKGETVKEIAEDMDIPKADVRPIVTKPDLMDYAKKIREEGYDSPEIAKTNDYIYEIDYSELDEENYERIDLTLYADGILADDKDYPVRDTVFVVGEHYLEWFEGKDEMYIRNEKRHADYDICRSLLTFGEMLDRHPETQQRLQYDAAMEDYYSGEDDEDEEEDDE